MNYKVTQYKQTDGSKVIAPSDILVSDELMSKSDAEINKILPDDVPAGCVIHNNGYKIIKEKSLTGTWTEV